MPAFVCGCSHTDDPSHPLDEKCMICECPKFTWDGADTVQTRYPTRTKCYSCDAPLIISTESKITHWRCSDCGAKGAYRAAKESNKKEVKD